MSNWTRLKHSLLLLPLVAVLLTGCMTVQISEKHLLMPDRAITPSNIETAAPGYLMRELQLTTPDGVRLYGQLFSHPAARVNVLYFGGNNFRLQQNSRNMLEHYSKLGVNLMLVDHRGYGASEGVPSIETLFSDGLSSFDYLKQQLPDQPVIVHGFSLGSFIAGHVAKRRPVDALILEGSATNAEDWAAATTPFFAKPFIDVEIEPKLLAINNKDNLTALRAPLLVVVGENDSQTPPSLAKKLYAEAKQVRYRNYVEVPNLGHFSALKTAAFGQAFVALRDQLPGVN